MFEFPIVIKWAGVVWKSSSFIVLINGFGGQGTCIVEDLKFFTVIEG